MNTRRLRIAAAGLASWFAAASLLATPLGPPTPPPCTVDGNCTPARETWGYYKQQWRRWPGTEPLDRREQDEMKPGEGAIDPFEKPEAAIEDRQAPEKVEALEPQPRDLEGENTSETPGFPAEEPGLPRERRPAGERFPAEERRPAGERGGEEPLDPQRPELPPFLQEPGGLPFGNPPGEGAELPFGQPPATPAAPTEAPPSDLFPSNLRLNPPAQSIHSDDAPPPLPFAAGALSARENQAPANWQSPVRQASAIGPTAAQPRVRVGAIPTEVSLPGRAVRLDHTGDAPPRLPPMFRSPH